MPKLILFHGTIIFEHGGGQYKIWGCSKSPHPQSTCSLLWRFLVLKCVLKSPEEPYKENGCQAPPTEIPAKLVWSGAWASAFFKAPRWLYCSLRTANPEICHVICVQGHCLCGLLDSDRTRSPWNEGKRVVFCCVNPHKPSNEKSLWSCWPNQRGRAPRLEPGICRLVCFVALIVTEVKGPLWEEVKWVLPASREGEVRSHSSHTI